LQSEKLTQSNLTPSPQIISPHSLGGEGLRLCCRKVKQYWTHLNSAAGMAAEEASTFWHQLLSRGVLLCEWRLPLLVLVGGGGDGVNIHCSGNVGCWWQQRSQWRRQRCNSKVGGRKQIGMSAAMLALSKNSCGSSRQIIWSGRRGNVGKRKEQ
jgi:hypothetical protein